MHQSETAAFLNHKGGVGKTTSVVNAGAGLTILGKRVLLVDLDPQGHLTSFLGISPDEYTGTISNILRGDIHPRDAIVTRDLSARLCINGEESRLALSVIPADSTLAESEMSLTYRSEKEHLLKRAMGRISNDYDYILFDCSPSLGLISINALAASRKVFIPVQTEYLALSSLEGLLNKIEFIMDEVNQDLVIGGFIATRFDKRKVLSRTVVEALKERFGALFLDTIIRENIALAESPGVGKDIFSYRPRSYGAQDYLNLSLEIIGRAAADKNLFSVERGVITSNTDSVATV